MAFLPPMNTGSQSARRGRSGSGGGAAGVDGVSHFDQIGNGGGVIQTDPHGVVATVDRSTMTSPTLTKPPPHGLQP